MFLVDAFNEGPLAAGVKCKTIVQEIGEIAMALKAVGYGLSDEVCVGAVRPFVADLHQDMIMKSMESYAADIKKSLEEAIDLIDNVSMADFGSDRGTDVMVVQAMKSCEKFQGVERLASKLQEVGEAAIEAGDGNKTEAAKMIAVVMIAEKMTWFPTHFAYAAGWCSDSMYQSFDKKGLFAHAFDLVMNVVPDFDA